MTIFLSEADAQKIIHPTNAFAAMKRVFEHQAQHKIENYPRQRRKVFDKSLNITMASVQVRCDLSLCAQDEMKQRHVMK